MIMIESIGVDGVIWQSVFFVFCALNTQNTTPSHNQINGIVKYKTIPFRSNTMHIVMIFTFYCPIAVMIHTLTTTENMIMVVIV